LEKITGFGERMAVQGDFANRPEKLEKTLN